MRFSRGLMIHFVRGRGLWLLLAGVLICPDSMRAQSGQTVTVDQATMQALLKRIDRLEARVQQLEMAQRQTAPQLAKTD